MKNSAKVITISDTKGGSTKSTTAVNVAYICACSGLKTLLLDFDLEQPTACSYFPLKNEAVTVNKNWRHSKVVFSKLYSNSTGEINPSL